MGHFFTPWDPCLHIGWFPAPETQRVPIPDAPPFLRGLKALFLSDIHLRKCVSDEKLGALIAQIHAAKAELILLGGDYAETPSQCARFFEALSGTQAPLGVFGVPGNNDAPDSLPQYMEKAGAVLLRNRAVSIRLPGGKLQVGGCDEHKYGSPRTRDIFSGGGYRILLSHFPIRPDCAPELMLSGHTHGGQMNILGVTPYSLAFERRWRMLGVRGSTCFGSTRLVICSGVGVSRLPLRIGAKPHMLLLDFGSAEG